MNVCEVPFTAKNTGMDSNINETLKWIPNSIVKPLITMNGRTCRRMAQFKWHAICFVCKDIPNVSDFMIQFIAS